MNSFPLETYLSMDDVPIMLTVEEMGRLLRVSRNTAYDYVRKGKVPYIKVGKQIRIYRGDVLAIRNKTAS